MPNFQRPTSWAQAGKSIPAYKTTHEDLHGEESKRGSLHHAADVGNTYQKS